MICVLAAQALAANRLAASELLEPNPELPGKRRIRPELWPDVSFVNVGVRGDASELNGARTLEPLKDGGAKTSIKFVDAVAGVIDAAMESDERNGAGRI